MLITDMGQEHHVAPLAMGHRAVLPSAKAPLRYTHQAAGARLGKLAAIVVKERKLHGFWAAKKWMVGSTGQRNGLSKLISWGPEAKGFAWASIEAEGDLIKVILTVDGQIRSVGEVLAQQTGTKPRQVQNGSSSSWPSSW